ncbi:MAG: CBS domain-containing protein [Clostridia bacterium]|nr:CBS domain-containing protein [Clostridia bacterium]
MLSVMDNSEMFLEKYKNLEKAVRSAYGLKRGESISRYLAEKTKYKKFEDEIRYCQEVRNFLVHEKKISNEFALEPSDAMINFIEELTKSIVNLPKCHHIQVKFKNIYWRKMSDSVAETVAVMKEKAYTDVPVLDDNGVVIGVFNENSVFCCIAEGKDVAKDNGLTLFDIKEHLSVTDRETESFVFVRPSLYVWELEDMIEREFEKGSRIGIAFVTASGRADEKLQGIITPWDVIKAND